MMKLRQRLIGAMLCLALVALSLALVPGLVEDDAAAPAVLARIFDSLVPQWLAAALLFSVLGAVLGAWRAGTIMALAALATGGWFAFGHVQRSLPLAAGAEPVLKVLFFNTRVGNADNAARIAAAVEQSGADVVALAESESMRSALPELRRAFPHVRGCERSCNVLVLSKLPFAGEPSDLPAPRWNGRLRPVRVELADGQSVSLVALQAPKPWVFEPGERAGPDLEAVLHDIAGPVVVAGDFNAAPWARPTRALLDESGLRAPRLPVATWPVQAGPAGVPIDNVFVRGGARLVKLTSFGSDLGSNHLGLMAEIALGG